jgi:purine-cytosine permease-like protein
MTDVPPDNGASGFPPAMPSEPPVVRRSNFSEPPLGTEPPTFDDDALADAMAAEVAPYTAPITLPKPPIAPAAEIPSTVVPAAPVPAPAPFAAPAPDAGAPAMTWDGRPPAEEAAAPAVAASMPTPPPPPTFDPPTGSVGDGEPSEEDLRRALGGASTLETIERLETELKHISNGEPTILPVTATPAAGMTLGTPAPGPGPDAVSAPAAIPVVPSLPPESVGLPMPVAPLPFVEQAPETIAPALVPEPVPPAPATPEPAVAEPASADVATAWPFPPPSESGPEPAIDLPAPGQFFPTAAGVQPLETALPEPIPSGESAAPIEGDPWSFPAPDESAAAVAPDQAPSSAPAVDPLAWLAPPADSSFPPPPEAAAFAFDPPADDVSFAAPPVAPESESAPELTAPEPFAPEPPDPRSYAPYPFEVDPSLIDPVAAASLAPAAETPVASTSAMLPREPAAAVPAAVEPAPVEPAAVEPAAADPAPRESPWWAAPEQANGAWQPAAPDTEAAAPVEPAASFSVPTPYSTEPPVGPESPDWLSAPPPVFKAPDLVEPPGFVDSPPNAALDPVAPITANTMASLPMPLPTDQPNFADRAELPPPPGYEDIPIMSSDVTAPPQPVAPSAFFPAAVPEAAPASALVATPIAAPPLVVPAAPAPTLAPEDPAVPMGPPPTATPPSGVDHEDDDVIDAVDRVTGTGAIPISSAGTVEPLAPPSEPIATIRLTEGQPALVDEQPKEPPAFEVEAAGPEPTPLDMRAGRAARLFWLWFAANSSVLSMGLGAVLLTTGMSLRQSIVATLAGVAISFLPLGLGTLAGKWSGQPTMIVSRASFGHAGNILPALLAVLTRVLWGGVLLWLLATAVAQVLVGAGLDAGLGTTVWQLVGLVAGFVIATVIAVFGYGFVAKLQLVVSVVSGLLIVGSAALTYQHLDFAKALTVPDGNWILVISGAALVFSVVGLAWVHSSSDLARYQRAGSSGAASMLWATFGATLPPFLLVVWGAMLAASDPSLGKRLTTNPLAAIASLLPAWYPAPLLAFAALGLLSGAVVTMYSGGFALQALGLTLRRNLGTLISSILVLAVSAALLFVVTDFSSLVRGLIITIAVPVAAWAGIFAAEMMIRTRRFHTPSLLAPGGIYPQLRPLNFLALVAISVIGLGLVSSSIPGLGWEGFLFGLAGIGPQSPLAASDVGVFVALLLGILVPLIGGIPSIRRQERASSAA